MTGYRPPTASGVAAEAAPSLGVARLVAIPRQVALDPLVPAVVPTLVEVTDLPDQAAAVPSHGDSPTGPALSPLAVEVPGHTRRGVPDARFVTAVLSASLVVASCSFSRLLAHERPVMYRTNNADQQESQRRLRSLQDQPGAILGEIRGEGRSRAHCLLCWTRRT